MGGGALVCACEGRLHPCERVRGGCTRACEGRRVPVRECEGRCVRLGATLRFGWEPGCRRGPVVGGGEHRGDPAFFLFFFFPLDAGRSPARRLPAAGPRSNDAALALPCPPPAPRLRAAGSGVALPPRAHRLGSAGGGGGGAAWGLPPPAALGAERITNERRGPATRARGHPGM